MTKPLSRHLTRNEATLLGMLTSSNAYWTKKGKLEIDGSFYASTKQLATNMECHENTIANLKKRLREKGEIEFRAGSGRGKATYFWIGSKSKIKDTQIPTQSLHITPEIEKSIRYQAGTKAGEHIVSNYVSAGYIQEEIEAFLGSL